MFSSLFLVSSPGIPYWRLSCFYFFYFAVLGAWLPFWPLYLQDLQFDAESIGYISGVMMATKIVAPSVWGWVADKTGQRVLVVRWGAFIATLIFCGIFVSQQLWWMVIIVAGYSFFWNAILAPFEVVTLQHLGNRYQQYSQIRLWGSIGFIVLVSTLGWLFDYIEMTWLPWIVCFLLLGILFSSFLVPYKDLTKAAKGQKGQLIKVIKRPEVIAFMIVCFLMQISHGSYYTFFSVYLEEYGYSRAATGLLWSLGVFAEVIVFIVMHKLLSSFSLKSIMIVSLLFGVLRWILIALFVDSLPVLLFAQVLHAATFGSFHAFAVEMIRKVFCNGLEGQGMALYSGLSFGAGGAIGAILSGYLWSYSHSFTFIMSAVFCALAICIGLLMMFKKPAN